MSFESFRSELSASSCSCLSIPTVLHSILFISHLNVPCPFTPLHSIHFFPFSHSLFHTLLSIQFHPILSMSSHAMLTIPLYPLRGDACIASLSICLSSLLTPLSSLSDSRTGWGVAGHARHFWYLCNWEFWNSKSLSLSWIWNGYGDRMDTLKRCFELPAHSRDAFLCFS